jgi:tetratricopeptide (TPR) repeat protein
MQTPKSNDPLRTNDYVPPLKPEALGETAMLLAPGSALPTPETALFPVVSVPGYEILGELGRGGMGVVYKARQLGLGRMVALKMILSGGQASSADLDRFRTEAEAIARLQHPNIVQVHEVGEHEGKPYFSLEFCTGGSLDRKLDGTPLKPPDAARLVETLARAMQAAHEKNVIHRDLKPANVLLTEDGTPKITDFGLAKKLDDVGQTASGVMLGTPSYVAPEQASGSKAIGPACDVYALGAILYELLTGRPPFKAATTLDTILQVISNEPVPPIQLQPQTPRDLDTICLKCLHKAPGSRYASTGDLAEDLARFLRDEPIHARPAGLVERAGKFVRRNRLLVGAGLAVFVALLAGAVTALVFALAADRARKAEEAAAGQLRRQLAESHFTTAKLAVQRGQYRQAIESLNRALEQGYPDTIALHLGLAKAYDAVVETDQARKILDVLAQEPDLGEHEGEVLLLRAALSFKPQDEDFLKQLRLAREKGLPPAEDAYARALLSETTPEALACCDQALREDRYHYGAHALSSLLLLLQGRFEEARHSLAVFSILFPEDPGPLCMAVYVEACDGKEKKAREIFKELKPRLLPRDASIVEGLIAVGVYQSSSDDPPNLLKEVRYQMSFVRLVPELVNFVPWMSDGKSKSAESNLGRMLTLPPSVGKALGGMLKTYGTLAGGSPDDNALRLFEESLQRHPEGSMAYFHGAGLLLRRRWQDGRASLMKAIQMPGLVRVRRQALLALLRVEQYLLSQTKSKDEGLSKDALEHFHEFLRLGSPRKDELYVLGALAWRLGEYHAAEEFLSTVDRDGGGSDWGIVVLRLRTAQKLGNHARVVEMADRILKVKPQPGEVEKLNSIQPEVKQQRQDAMKAIELLVQQDRR